MQDSGRVTNRIDNGVQMNEFTYNPRSEVLTALFGTNGTEYVYDDIGNHSLYPANSLNQYLDSGIEYDLDGNMIRHGGFTFGWDGENRLVSVGNGTTNIVNTYDYKHRRVRKTVNGESHAFIYDGWNLLSETTSVEARHYFWGLDLSDSLQGAGGVGGLLAVSQSGSMYYPVYDNNGNVTAYLDDLGNTVASYEYNAFGETISQSGNKANDFTFRFSTKYHDNETGLYYYGYRFYSSVLRTWLSRDPIGEDGGLNLYGFCGNNPVDRFDVLGLIGGWAGATDKFFVWVLGAPPVTKFDESTPESIEMSKSSIGQTLRKRFLAQNKGIDCSKWIPLPEYGLKFRAREFIVDLPNGTAHFVGSARGKVEIESRFNRKLTARFTLKNITSLTSFLYHLLPDSGNITKPNFPGSNWTQYYTWLEEFNCCGSRILHD